MKNFKTKNGLFTGNVGIGTTSPGAKLEVHQDGNAFSIKSTDTEQKLRVFTAANGSVLGLTDGGVDIIRLDGRTVSPNASYFNGGKVGIGTTSPNVSLEVSGPWSSQFRISRDIQQGQYSEISGGGSSMRFKSVDSSTHSSFSFVSDNGTDEVERVRIDASGNVGIGTTNPSAFSAGADKLVLDAGTEGGMTIKSATTGYGAIFFADGTNGTEQYRGFLQYNHGNSPHPTDSLVIGTAGSTKMTILSNGNVGIGTASPGNILNIYDGDAGSAGTPANPDWSDSLFLQRNIPNNYQGTRILFAHGSASIGGFREDNTEDGSHHLAFYTGGNVSGVNEAIRINSAGNVGIGVTNPEAFDAEANQLVVRGNTHGGITIFAGTNASRGNLYFSDGVVGNQAYIGGISYDHGDDDLSLRTNGAERVWIKGSGNVGIGTANPEFKLDVVAPATMVLGGSDDELGATNNYAKSSRVGGIAYTNSDLPVHMMMHTSSASASILYFGWGTGSMYCPTKIIFGTADNTTTTSSTAGNKRMFIHSNGNVSIGADNDSYKFYVSGSAYSTGTWGSSDDRLKHNEETIVGAIETLRKITPKKYIKTTEMYDADHDFGLDSDGKPVDENGDPVEHFIEAGVIAQEVLSVDELAFAVKEGSTDEDGNETPHALNYNSLFTYAIAAIQEQQQLIESQKQLIESQQSTVDDLISRVESLES